MAGVEYSVRVESELAIKALSSITPEAMREIAYNISQMLEVQTQDRIADEKTSPEGLPWAPWSKRYAASLVRPNRVNPRSLLVGHPNLLPSIQNYTTGLEARVGSNMVYAAIHQFGGRGIPARPYLGLSRANRRDITEMVIDSLEAGLQ